MVNSLLGKAIFLFVILASSVPLSAGDWKFNGYIQTIPYIDGRDFSNDTYMPFYTSMKLRFGAEKSIGDYLDFNAQMQNSRVFGEEGAITNNKSIIFLIQGYLEFKNILDKPISFKVGRYQLDYGTGRFIGVSPWNYVERAFDGFTAKYEISDFILETFYAKHISETKTQNGNAHPRASIFRQTEYNDYDMAGVFTESKLSEDMKVQLLGYTEINNAKNDDGAKMLERFTVAATFIKSANPFGITVELSYQGGKNQGKNISAYLTAARIDYKVADFIFTIANDRHSGTKPNSDELNTFDNYTASKHRFFGLMDYFTTINTNYSLGADDYWGGVAWRFAKDWNMSFYVHHFVANADSKGYGTELDFIIRHNLDKNIFVECGNAVFMPDNLMIDMFESALGTKHRDPAFVSYVRFTAKL